MRLAATVAAPPFRWPRVDAAAAMRAGTRPVYHDGRWEDAAVYDRLTLGADTVLAGPAIVEQPDATVVIDPGATAVVDALGNLVISVGAT